MSARELVAVGEATHARIRATPNDVSSANDLVALAADTIIPRTETAGAIDAGVPDFIAMMLRDWYTPDEAARFMSGIATLDAASTARVHKSFADASTAEREKVLSAIDEEVVSLRRTNERDASQHWFATLKYLTVFGYCTSEVAMRTVLHAYPRAMKYDGAAPVP
jgi:hypothetical protein